MTLRQVDELITLHELPNAEKEVITEGKVDACILEWFLRSRDIQTPVYCRMERIEGDEDAVKKYGYSIGERGFVLAASRIVDQHPKAAASITFVVDGDFDHSLNPPVPSGQSLLVTDYSCIESYCFHSTILEKFLRLILRASGAITAASLLDGIRQTLTDVFVSRWILNNIGSGVGIVSRVTRRCTLEGPQLVLNSLALMRDAIQASDSRVAKKMTDEYLMTRFAEESAKLVGIDTRFTLNGHDLAVGTVQEGDAFVRAVAGGQLELVDVVNWIESHARPLL